MPFPKPHKPERHRVLVGEAHFALAAQLRAVDRCEVVPALPAAAVGASCARGELRAARGDGRPWIWIPSPDEARVSGAISASMRRGYHCS